MTVAVRDMDEAVGFYRTLGLRLIVQTHERYARFEAPSGSATFSLHLDPGMAEPGDHPVLYFETDDLAARVAELEAAGIVFDTAPALQSWRWEEARLRDPSGNRLCLYHAGPERRFPPWRTAT